MVISMFRPRGRLQGGLFENKRSIIITICLNHFTVLKTLYNSGEIKGWIEVIGRRGRIRRKLLDDLEERRGYFHLKEEALDRTMWRARVGRGFGPVVRQTAK
jgi:hypothetical protein